MGVFHIIGYIWILLFLGILLYKGPKVFLAIAISSFLSIITCYNIYVFLSFPSGRNLESFTLIIIATPFVGIILTLLTYLFFKSTKNNEVLLGYVRRIASAWAFCSALFLGSIMGLESFSKYQTHKKSEAFKQEGIEYYRRAIAEDLVPYPGSSLEMYGLLTSDDMNKVVSFYKDKLSKEFVLDSRGDKPLFIKNPNANTYPVISISEWDKSRLIQYSVWDDRKLVTHITTCFRELMSRKHFKEATSYFSPTLLKKVGGPNGIYKWLELRGHNSYLTNSTYIIKLNEREGVVGMSIPEKVKGRRGEISCELKVHFTKSNGSWNIDDFETARELENI